MIIGKLLRTISQLRMRQIIYQLRNRIVSRKYVYRAPSVPKINHINTVKWIDKPISFDNDRFCFLNLEAEYGGWCDRSKGMLWAYNLNYMDWINQREANMTTSLNWIDKFISEINTNDIGTDPYPTALRIINWVKFFSSHQENISDRHLSSLYSQILHLENNIEYHLLGNHILEDAFALFIGSNYLRDDRLLKKSTRLLIKELNRQILPDGAHYEQSPMYHCILLDRLLDCVNFDTTDNIFLKDVAVKMLGHLENMLWSDRSYPLFNDSAYGIAPMPTEIFDYAKRLSLEWSPISLGESGYRHLKSRHFDLIVDCGKIRACYQPGHSHADALSYELQVDGANLIVDTGISTYEKNARRQFERGSCAHNTVTVEDRDSSEVWGGFRVGGRSCVKIIEDGTNKVRAQCRGYRDKHIHKRVFDCKERSVSITDSLTGGVVGISRLYIAPHLKVKKISDCKVAIDNGVTITVKDAISFVIKDALVSKEYNRFEKTAVVEILFSGIMQYSFSI